MSNIYGKFDGKSIYKIEHLTNGELTDGDLNLLLEGTHLNFSLIVAEYRFIGDKRKHDEILSHCLLVEDWFDRTSWTIEQQDEFRNILAKVYKNIYYYSEKRCLDMADMWLLNFGFRCIHE